MFSLRLKLKTSSGVSKACQNNNNNNNNNNNWNKWYMHNPVSVLENETHTLIWDFLIQMDPLISFRPQGFIIINRQKRTCRIMDFALPADHRVKLKESEKKDKYLDLARGNEKTLKHVTIIPILIGALGTVTKGLVQGLKDLEITGRVETIQTTALLRSARIMRRVLETWGHLLSLKRQWKTIKNFT